MMYYDLLYYICIYISYNVVLCKHIYWSMHQPNVTYYVLYNIMLYQYTML